MIVSITLLLILKKMVVKVENKKESSS